MIVLGTNGATGERNIIFGSVASSIINMSDVPVLAVPPGGSPDDIKHITFATDYHEGDLQILQQTINFARLFEANIEIIHVSEQKSQLDEIKFRGSRDLVKGETDYEDISFELKYGSDFFPVMADYLSSKPCSLPVMVRYKKTFWEKLVEKNHSNEMVFNSNIPLLVLIGD
ncbi:universal stress protein [Aliifodinibius sp. 1BSP15-2V2]|uniref:Universal stress protein n=1 Tax=Fodinibius salsisoli TaxID=2820877 RepID=A0ABT3PH19_9BACT|nr:universal stress protein [Fodinibius salsisoli]